MNSMLDLEQLRLSIIEQDIPSSIGQVHQWIETHGINLLKSNQKLPLDYHEAEEIRKQHEKVELKCMTFLAFYAKINLKDIPKEYTELKEDLDVLIQKFSEHIKARRHVVVTFFTFFRHMIELKENLEDLQSLDLSNLPESIGDINKLIQQFHRDINHCIKRMTHVTVEADRVKSSIDSILTLDSDSTFNYIDRGRLGHSKSHIEMLLREMEANVTKIFESQRLLELELQIESKMMVIEHDIAGCCDWLQKMEERTAEMYREKVVGMATVECDVLLPEVEELSKKMKMTKEYGEKLMNLYEDLCVQFKRDMSRGRQSWSKLNDVWALSELISNEFLRRLTKATELFHGLDTTLDKIENTLQSINKDKNNDISDEDIIDKYQDLRDRVSTEFLNLKQSANNLFKKLSCDLFNEKLKSSDEVFRVTEPIKDVVKMKLFTIAVKLKELDRFDFQTDTSLIVCQKEAGTKAEPIILNLSDGDFRENLDNYLDYLNATKLEWESKPLPVTIDKATKRLNYHQDISNRSGLYWEDIQAAFDTFRFQSINEIDIYQNLLSNVGQEKKNWDNRWRLYLDQDLNPRYQILKKLQDFQMSLDESMSSLDDFISQSNHNLAIVTDLTNELTNMKCHVQNKEQMLKKLHKDAIAIHATDFKNQLSSVDQSLQHCRDRLCTFFDLESMILEILEFLHQRNLYQNSSYDDVANETEKMVSRASEFDVETLRKLALLTYGDSMPVEWLIDELRMELVAPSKFTICEELIVPTNNVRQSLMHSPQACLQNEAPSSQLNVPLKTSIGQVEPLFGDKILICRKDPLILELKLTGYRFSPLCKLMHNGRSANVNDRLSHWTRIASNRFIEFSHPAIAKFDCGHYEIVIDDEIVAKTNVVVGDAPKVLRHLLIERVKSGDAASIVVPMENIANKLDQMVIWKKDSKPLSLEIGSVTCGVNRDHDPVLEIKNMKSINAGTYRCDISNEYGQAATEVRLEMVDSATNDTQSTRKAPNFVRPLEQRVTSAGGRPGSPYELSEVDEILEGAFAPQFIETFTDKIVEEGDDVILKCSLIGSPKPTTWWTMNARLLNNPRFKIVELLEENSLLMRKVRTEDSGRYSMTAENSCGLVTCSARITVKNKDMT